MDPSGESDATTFLFIHTNEFQLQIQSSYEKSYIDFASWAYLA